MRSFSILLLAFFAWIPCGTQAALIERDLFTPGDGLVSYDLATGLDWLDLGVTKGLAVDEIIAGAGGWIANDWRYATRDEVVAMWASVGVTHREAPQADYGELAAVTAFFDLFGILAQDVIQPGNIQRSQAQGWINYSIDLLPGHSIAAAISTFDDLTAADVTNLALSSGQADDIGSYLVRQASVPEPSTLGLLCVGLLGLVLMRRKSRTA